jgi:Lrp/AsnC family transcriptional regulator, leucine-responsive regulatory protein
LTPRLIHPSRRNLARFRRERVVADREGRPAGAVGAARKVREMDTVDRLLLETLRSNARATYAELARVVGLSAPAVHERVAKLEATQVITGYHAAVAPQALGYATAALVGVFISDRADTDQVAAAIAELPEIEDCWFVAGEETFVLKVRVRDVGALEQAIRSLHRIDGIARTRTTVVLSTKFEGRVLSGRQASD